MKSSRFDGTDVRRILAAMITDRVVIARISVIWPDEGLFSAPWANIVGGMVVRYFREYATPPAGQMLPLFEEWSRTTPASEEVVGLVETFLRAVSDVEHQDPSDYILDLAGTHFNKVSLDKTSEALRAALGNWEVTEAQKILEEHRRISLGTGSWDSPCSDIDIWESAFDKNRVRPLFSYRQDLGEFIGDAFQRGRFFSFMAPDKTGKSCWLIDAAFRALAAGNRVAFFDTGDGIRDEFLRRLACRITGTPLWEQDCFIPKGWIDDKVNMEKTHLEAVDYVMAFRELRRVTRNETAFRLSIHASGSVSAADIDGMLVEADQSEDWRPDVCIASGSLVLTDRGLVPIEKIQCNDRLWDGRSWVSHDGLVFKGVKDVIEYAGITATPDHRMWTEYGWRTLESCAYLGLRIAKTGDGRKPIRIGKDYISDCSYKKNTSKEQRVCICAMCAMRIGEVDFIRESQTRHSERLQGVFATEEILEGVLATPGECASKMSKSKFGGMVALRRQGHRIPFSIDIGGVFVDYREFGNAREGYGVGSCRQQRTLRAGEFEMVDKAAEYSSYEKEGRDCNGLSLSRVVSRCSLCGRDFEEILQMGMVSREDHRELESDSPKVWKSPVWDIRNTGPFHCFTVQGLLAHNCIIDYADLLAPPRGVKDSIEQIDETWKRLHRIAQERHCLVLTATQSSALAYKEGETLLGKKHFSGRKTKLAHVDGMLGINVSPKEKDSDAARINWIVRRGAAYNERRFVRVAGCLAFGNPAIVSMKPQSKTEKTES